MAWLNIAKVNEQTKRAGDVWPKWSTGFSEQWDYIMRSYNRSGHFRIQTVHRGEHSLDVEIAASLKDEGMVDVFKINHKKKTIDYMGSARG